MTDYTVVWLPSHLAGNSHEDSTAVEDDDPQIYLISGSGYYEEVLPGDVARATVQRPTRAGSAMAITGSID